MQRTANRLINEKSPYLLQHAYNPVNWFPWGEEAFERAKLEDKPIFLSIGYSTCHWCHVMERESFEDEEVASFLNDNFVSIKVDREERPDVDNIYMTACMMINGSGGWPLCVFLTHDKKPFYAGTYFPKEDKYGIIGFKTLLTRIKELWEKDKFKVELASEQMLENLKIEREPLSDISYEVIEKAAKELEESFDPVYGGFDKAPKFPSPHNLMFLMRMNYKTEDKESRNIVEKTLKSMYNGGIYDHVGGGFARYSTDNKWIVPHFEKMLYDNALLIIAYTEAYQISPNPIFKRVVERTAEFIIREMRDKNGGFYTAIDADSDGQEGSFYVWSLKEIEEILGEEEGKKYCALYGISNPGNFEGKSIPNLVGRNLPEEEYKFADSMAEKLLNARNERIRPSLDDKILTSNNALSVAAFSKAGFVFKREDWIFYAEEAARFVLKNLVKEKVIYSSFREKASSNIATVDAYSYLVWAFIELYESTFDPLWLKLALEWNENMFELFGDERKGLYFSSKDIKDIPIRQVNANDGAIPSGYSVAVNNLVRLSQLIQDERLKERATKLLRCIWSEVEAYPSGYTALLAAFLHLMKSGEEITIAEGVESENFLSVIRDRFMPFATVILCGKGHEKIYETAKYAAEMKTGVYVCKDRACYPPVTSVEEFSVLLT